MAVAEISGQNKQIYRNVKVVNRSMINDYVDLHMYIDKMWDEIFNVAELKGKVLDIKACSINISANLYDIVYDIAVSNFLPLNPPKSYKGITILRDYYDDTKIEYGFICMEIVLKKQMEITLNKSPLMLERLTLGDYMDCITAEKVIFNNPATVVLWSDGTKTVVKRQKGDKWDYEKGLAMAIIKKFLGLKEFYSMLDDAEGMD